MVPVEGKGGHGACGFDGGVVLLRIGAQPEAVFEVQAEVFDGFRAQFLGHAVDDVVGTLAIDLGEFGQDAQATGGLGGIEGRPAPLGRRLFVDQIGGYVARVDGLSSAGVSRKEPFEVGVRASEQPVGSGSEFFRQTSSARAGLGPDRRVLRGNGPVHSDPSINWYAGSVRKSG